MLPVSTAATMSVVPAWFWAVATPSASMVAMRPSDVTHDIRTPGTMSPLAFSATATKR